MKGGATGCDAYDEYIQLDAPYKIGSPPNAESETHNPQPAGVWTMVDAKAGGGVV